MTALWVIHDWDPVRKAEGCRPVGARDPHVLNREGYGVFTPVNAFRGARRISNLIRIRSWCAEIDGDKGAAQRKIARSPLRPSIVVESRNGLHLWFLAQDGTPENYGAIVADRLVPAFDADPNAKDIARVLRVPGFNHMKQPDDPFPVTVADRCDAVYREAEMLEAFADIGGAQRRLRERQRQARAARAQMLPTGDIWDRAYALDCEQALTRLSGHPAVSGEVYEFRRVSKGHLNIIVNGEPTSCFIDANGKIGSGDKGGPGIAQWLKWFGRSYKEVRRILLDVFPELGEGAA